MNTGAVFIISYCIQIPLAIYAAFFMPMRGQLTTFYENGRKGIIAFGILPCAFLGVIIQLLYLAVYMAKVKSLEAKGSRAQAKLGDATRGLASSGGNPFGGGRSTGQDSSGAVNPFAPGGGQSQPSQTGANPFAGDSSDEPTSRPTDNPFA